MKIMTWNVLNDAESWWDRIPGIIEVILKERPNVICLQEVPDGGRNTLKVELRKFGYTISGSSQCSRSDKSYVAWKSEAYDSIAFRTIKNIDVVSARLHDRVMNTNLVVYSYHGAWGADRTRSRLRETRSIMTTTDRNEDSSSIVEPGDLVYWAGDFNAEDNEKTMRIIHGLEEEPVFWTEFTRTMRNPPLSTTLTTGLGAQVALKNKIVSPENLPHRVIDHILVRGWMYGKIGGFRSLKTIDRDDLSDHSALIACTF
jgi:endonuclease/exonuclease/phosphatase family metal-dependent hydrolase